MLDLLIGFLAMVLLPALVLSLIINKLNRNKWDDSARDDGLQFTLNRVQDIGGIKR